MSEHAQKITVFTAKKIITMNDSLPTATAVAIRHGKILSTGSLKNLQPLRSCAETNQRHSDLGTLFEERPFQLNTH